MEDNSVPEGIACHQEVMIGSEKNRSYRHLSRAEPLPAAVLMVLRILKQLVLILNKSLPQMKNINPQLFTSYHM